MEAYAKRFVAWSEGNPDWSRLTSRDSIDRRYPPIEEGDANEETPFREGKR